MSDETGFETDPRLLENGFDVIDLPLSRVRLVDNRRVVWLVLVPRRPGLADLIDLAPADRLQLVAEEDAAARALLAETGCDKLNVAALGNTVRQLHVHVVARFKTDPAWPGAIWGRLPEEPFPSGEGAALAKRLAARLADAPPGPLAG